MGENLLMNGTLICIGEDGKEKRIGPVKKITLSNNYKFKSPAGAILEVKLPRISRKRFVKLLMSRGYRRNEANQCAEFVRRVYGEYPLGTLAGLDLGRN